MGLVEWGQFAASIGVVPAVLFFVLVRLEKAVKELQDAEVENGHKIDNLVATLLGRGGWNDTR